MRSDCCAITIAILAMGGEGGGVLADWIVDLAEHAGYLRAEHFGAGRSAAYRERPSIISRYFPRRPQRQRVESRCWR